MPRTPARSFNHDLEFDSVDFRAQPELYRVGRSEQGVLLVEPYKSEILPHWRFATPEAAEASSRKIAAMFEEYKALGDFVGMDMARKFLQMGWTRARRYANHRSGRKYVKGSKEVLPRDEDPVKAESARIFYARYVAAREDPDYKRMKAEHIARFSGEKPVPALAEGDEGGGTQVL
jgi:hypothetical protein